MDCAQDDADKWEAQKSDFVINFRTVNNVYLGRARCLENWTKQELSGRGSLSPVPLSPP